IFPYFEGKLQAPVLLIFLILVLMHLARFFLNRPTFIRATALGIVLGLFALTRPNILLFLPVLLGWAAWFIARRKALKKLPLLAIAMILGTAATIAPATLRNYIKSNDPVLISANAGVNLFIGNNPAADGTFMHGIPDIELFRNCFDYPSLVRALEAKLDRKLTYTEISRYYAAKAWDFIRNNPSRFFELLWIKTLYFWGPREIKHNNEVELDRRFSKTLSRLPGNYAALFSLALMGGLLMMIPLRRGNSSKPEEPREETRVMAALIGLFVLTYFSSYLPFFITSLYRIPIIPFLILFGAFGLSRLIGLARNRAYLACLGWIALPAALFGGLTLSIGAPDDGQAKRDLARWHFAKGVAYTGNHEPEKAIESYRKSLQADPYFVGSLCNLASLLEAKKEIKGAIEYYRKALALVPEMAEAHTGLANLLGAQGDFDSAKKHYQEALTVQPENVDANFCLANIFAKEKRFEEARVHFEKVIELNPGWAAAHCNLGFVLMNMGKPDQSLACFEVALRLDPDYDMACINMGTALNLLGRDREAAAYFERALKINPFDEVTRKRLEKVKKAGEGP
ncbi:MAG: tetratricopeptide repeat protein, partial [Planctomycetes bacterium]|nr:tetratricopeptide repeat protein [Planctomycetota bacterium]